MTTAYVPLRRILVANAKGGCGKTTVATNLSAYYAAHRRRPALVDWDPQGSSMRWLQQRSDTLAQVHGIFAHGRDTGSMTRTFRLQPPTGTERVVIDSPAGLRGRELQELVRGVDAILIPILPSAVDFHAVSYFIKELFFHTDVRRRGVRVGVVANRVKAHTLVYRELEVFLQRIGLPVVARLRDTVNYVRVAERGLGVHEVALGRFGPDRQQWEPLLHWLEGHWPERCA